MVKAVMTKHAQDWDPTSAEVLRNQVDAYDEMRARCPVARSELLGWSLFKHEDVVQVLEDPQTFSNVVSTRRSVPSGMDPPEHTVYRQAIEPYFAPERLTGFESHCRRIASDLLSSVSPDTEFDFIEAFAVPFASCCQCVSLGWSTELAEPVSQWTRRNREAILAHDRSALAEIASEFESRIARLFEERRRASASSPSDITSALMRVQVNGKPLTDEELTSILRNWTVGEVGSVAAALGILASHLVLSPDLQRRLRADPTSVPAAIEEILRVDGPLVSNKRRATRDATIGGRHIKAGDRVSLMWVSANRDERAFDEPHAVNLDRAQDENLLWGRGIHVCPGAPLARLEMRIALEALLSMFSEIELGSAAPTRLSYPENGWVSLPLRLRR
jgi:cytochrome P450